MAPTRMKLRVRHRDGGGNAPGRGRPDQEGEGEERTRERRSVGRRKKKPHSTPPCSSPPGVEASPDSKCPICLDRFNNLAYLDRCLHRFCFPCIQEWSRSKAECPLCKQGFSSILHSVRAEDDFKEYTLGPAQANGSLHATHASWRLPSPLSHFLATRARRWERVVGAGGGRGTRRGRGRAAGGAFVPSNSAPWQQQEEQQQQQQQEEEENGGVPQGIDEQLMGSAVIFEGLAGLRGAVALDDRLARRLMRRLAARRRLQLAGSAPRRLREREMLSFRRALYHCNVRVQGVASTDGSNPGQPQQDLTADGFSRSPTRLDRLRPWLQRELTVLYCTHSPLVEVVQRIISARLARRGLEDIPTVEEELRPFLSARTEHFLHELLSFARSPLSLESYDLRAVYQPPEGAAELGASSDSGDSVIAISEGEEDEQDATPEAPGPSNAESPVSPHRSPAPPSASLAEGGEGGEEECLIVGYVKPMAERTPELVQLSSDTEEEEEVKKGEAALPLLPSPPFIPPTTPDLHTDVCSPTEGDAGGSLARSCYVDSDASLLRGSLEDHEQQRDGYPQSSSAGERERRRKRHSRNRETDRQRRGEGEYNPIRSIFPSVFRRMELDSDSGSRSPHWEYRSFSCLPSSSSSPSLSSSPCSPGDHSHHGNKPHHGGHPYQVGKPPHSTGTHHSNPAHHGGPHHGGNPLHCSRPYHGNSTHRAERPHHGDKPGGKRKYKSRHLDDSDDPAWRPGSGRHGDGRKERVEMRRRERGRERERRRDARKDNSVCEEDSSSCTSGGSSGSVEIVYEGTVSASSLPPAPGNRRRKMRRRRKLQHSSSPVVITIASDSSSDGRCLSPPPSKPQEVDFSISGLPALPPVEPSGLTGGVLCPDAPAELPPDFLQRGPGARPAGQSGAAVALAVVDSDDEDRCGKLSSFQRSGATGGGEGGASPDDEQEAPPTGEKRKRSASEDSRLLATVLSDLAAIGQTGSDYGGGGTGRSAASQPDEGKSVGEEEEGGGGWAPPPNRAAAEGDSKDALLPVCSPDRGSASRGARTASPTSSTCSPFAKAPHPPVEVLSPGWRHHAVPSDASDPGRLLLPGEPLSLPRSEDPPLDGDLVNSDPGNSSSKRGLPVNLSADCGLAEVDLCGYPQSLTAGGKLDEAASGAWLRHPPTGHPPTGHAPTEHTHTEQAHSNELHVD